MAYYPHAINSLRTLIHKNFPDYQAKEGFDNVPSHLLWMMERIGEMENDSGKAGRWIGYILGRLEALGLLTNKESRDIVRQDVVNKNI